ncbi:hypothetical protein CLV33_101529 [Jejuia pallidilutea]|uniref:Lipoprotein n=1 Tax=Jejuia pallidilutea TaxID=504487 RepID=A0A362X835_9FLAO|nr:hypothetical protein [Jejuia pallidilutea]PQV51603.1 hypothetical protein CLV33_101529 [Jejuia pallidilutea]
MKKLSTFTLLMLSLMLLSTTSCKDDDDTPIDPIDQLPPPTQTGENTFGCLVNGEPLSTTNSNNMTAIYQGGFIQLGGIYMLVSEPIEINREYSLLGDARFIEDDDGPAKCYYDFENTYEGFIIFSKVDRTNHIISGTFEFSTTKENCETLIVTNGRFDMRYIP